MVDRLRPRKLSLSRTLVAGGVTASVLVSAGAQAQEGITEEVIVTARKRAESIQEVPLSVSVLDSAALEATGANSADDLYGQVPGLYFTASGGAAPTSDFHYLVLRGVGFNGGQEPSAGVFVDGMYQPQLGYDIGFLDLQRLEVLRGPQGTLFGRNTQAGALNLVTRRPDATLRARLETELAEFGTYRLHGSVSGPLRDNFFAGISAEYGESDGYMTNTLTGEPGAPSDAYAARGTLRWLPTDSLELVLTADRSERGGNEIALGGSLGCECYEMASDNDGNDTKRNEGLTLTAEWRPSDAVTLTSITGVRNVATNILIDFDGERTDQTPATANGVPGSRIVPQPVTFSGVAQRSRIDQEFFSEELRLSGGSETLDWLVGLYYFDQSQDQQRNFNIGAGVRHDPAIDFLFPTAIVEDFDTDRDGYALFAQASWRPFERFEATLGARFSDESVGVGGERMRNITQIENANPTFFVLDGEADFSDVSPLASLSWQFAPSLRGYVTVAQGWKAGGFTRFPSTPNAVLPYEAETSVNYEVGLKGEWPEQGFAANLAVFHIDIQDQQLIQTTPDANGVPVTTITNAGKSRSRGVELDMVLRPTDSFDVNASFAYTNAEFVDYTQRTAGGAALVRDGDPFEFVPQITGSLGLEYRIPVAETSTLALAANYRYVDGYDVPDGGFLVGLGASLPVEAYDRLDLRATVDVGEWKVAAYVRNVLDTFDYTQITYNGFVAPAPEEYLVTPLEPRTFGLLLSRRF